LFDSKKRIKEVKETLEVDQHNGIQNKKDQLQVIVNWNQKER